MSMEEEILVDLENYVQTELATEASGHDWWHIVRVSNLAVTIAQKEQANLFICQVAALLHDLADEKLNESEAAGLAKVREILEKYPLDKKVIAQILEIIATISFKGGQGQIPVTLEGKIVQDADRLDAIGAIGIARTMAYSGHKGRLIHDPAKKARKNLTISAYRSGEDTAIMHFYEKLLLLKDKMNTAYAKELAEKRHAFLEVYLEEFLAEWAGER